MHHFSDWFSKGEPALSKRNAGDYKKACCFLHLLPSSSMALLHKARRVFRRVAEHLGREAHHEREDEELRLAACRGASSLFRRASHALHKSSVNRNVAKLSRFWDTVRKSEAACYINRLPPELLSLIFTISVDNASHYLDSDFIPFTLTHVCTLWRDIAVELATLWHRFDLKPCLGTGRHAHLATICAKRAKGLGLAISYAELSPFDFDETEDVWDDNAAEFAQFCKCRLQLIGRIIIGQIRSLALVIGQPSATVRLTIDVAYPMGVSWQQLLAVDPLDLLWDMLADMADKGKATHYIKACMHWTDKLIVIPGQPRLTIAIKGEEPLDSMPMKPRLDGPSKAHGHSSSL
ncbi:hypothetical protein K525DRAFT_269852 [Schizophyllum commune Loenen D]|nr:hypothetical protein K525DRAFT_269852 [Schizophyllum commune Loenen D]